MGFFDDNSWIGDLGDVGHLLTDYSRGSAQGRQVDNTLAQNGDALRLRAPSINAHNAVQGDVMANAQDSHVTGLPSFVTKPDVSGGLRPSLLSAQTRELGGQMSREALLKQMNGTLTTPPSTPGAGEQIAGGLGTGLNIAKAASPILSKLPGVGSLFSSTAAGAANGLGGTGAIGAGLEQGTGDWGGIAAGDTGGGLSGAGGAASQVADASGLLLPLAVAGLGYKLGWYGDKAYDPNVQQDPTQTPGANVALGSDYFHPGQQGGISDTGLDEIIRQQAEQGYA